jgi:hypothetical protein
MNPTDNSIRGSFYNRWEQNHPSAVQQTTATKFPHCWNEDAPFTQEEIKVILDHFNHPRPSTL